MELNNYWGNFGNAIVVGDRQGHRSDQGRRGRLRRDGQGEQQVARPQRCEPARPAGPGRLFPSPPGRRAATPRRRLPIQGRMRGEQGGDAMTAVAAAQPPAPRRRSVWQRSRNTRTAYLFLLPALLVMAIITFYPLVFQVWMSFTRLRAEEPPAGRPGPPYVGLRQLHPDPRQQHRHPELRLPPAPRLQPVLGPLERRHPRRARGRDRADPQHEGAEVQRVLPGDLHPPGGRSRRSSWRRSGGTCSTAQYGRGEPAPQRHDRRPVQAAAGAHLDWLDRARTRSSPRVRSSSRSPTSRC